MNELYISRRGLLKNLGVAVSCGLVFSSHVAYAFSSQKLIVGMGWVAAFINFETAEISKTSLEFSPHSFVQHPINPDRIWVVERRVYADKKYAPSAKRGASASEIDLKTGRVVQNIYLPEASEFFGHGFFTPDGKVFFASRVDMEQAKGYLTGYDTADCTKIVADYPITDGALHESRLMPDGTAMIACFGVKPIAGEHPFSGPRLRKGALVQIDMKSGKPIHEWDVDDDTQMVGHFRVTRDGNIIVLSRPREGVTSSGKVFFGNMGGKKLEEIRFSDMVPAGKSGECLSIALNADETVAMVTNPENNRILMIDAKKGVYLGAAPIMAKGIVYDEKAHGFIGSGEKLCLLDDNGQIVKDSDSSQIGKLAGPFSSPHCLLI